MTYQVLARSWRPQRFEEVLGQDAVVQTLRNALSSSTLGHAYLFSGLRGVGKTTAARLLAKAVNCTEGPTPDPCGVCISCREIADGASLDVVELDAATHTGVDDVRDLQELLRFRPSRDRFRVVIVDEVHMLSKAAFNALLKSIEEPPPYVLWVFATTERHKVPATILSRCQQLEFRPVATEAIAKLLLQISDQEGFSLNRSAADAIARAAEGSVRDALSLLDQLRAFAADEVDDEAVATVLGVPRFQVMVDLVSALAGGDAATGLQVLRRELEAGRDATVLYQELGRLLRMTVHLALAPEMDGLLADDQRELLRQLTASLGADAAGRMLGLWVEQEGLLREAGNRELALEVAALRLARWPLVQRVERLLAGTDGAQVPRSSPQPPPSTPSTPSAPTSGSEGGGAGPSGGPGHRLAAARWREAPRLAGAVAAAEVSVDEEAVVSRPADGAEPLARAATAEAAVTTLEESCSAMPGVAAVGVDGHAATGGGGAALVDLETEAEEDPQLQLALKVLGGQVVAVRPDRDVS